VPHNSGTMPSCARRRRFTCAAAAAAGSAEAQSAALAREVNEHPANAVARGLTRSRFSSPRLRPLLAVDALPWLDYPAFHSPVKLASPEMRTPPWRGFPPLSPHRLGPHSQKSANWISPAPNNLQGTHSPVRTPPRDTRGRMSRSSTTTASEHRAAIANLLLELPEDAAFSSTFGQAFVTLPHTNQTFALSDALFHDWLRDRFYRHTGQPLTSNALHHITSTLRARAHCNPRRYVVGIRSAGTGSAIYIDLCNNDSEFVSITKDGWEITKTPEVTFHSTRGQLPLPRPATTHDERTTTNPHLSHPGIHEWLISSLSPTGPYPILILHGPPNSGKTTLAKMLRSLIDPVTAPLLPLPSRERAISKLAARHRVLAFDHVTHMSPTATDALCRISSGCGIEAEDSVQLEIARPIIITTPRNGIGDWIPRPDLASRSIAVHLPAIETPRPEADIQSDFETSRPTLLATLYTTLSESLTKPNAVRSTQYAARELYESTSHADPLFSPLLALATTQGNWSGTATDLLNRICVTPLLNCSTPRALSQRLNLLTPALISSGIEIEHHHKHGGARLITLRSTPRNPVTGFPDPSREGAGSSPSGDRRVAGYPVTELPRRDSPPPPPPKQTTPHRVNSDVCPRVEHQRHAVDLESGGRHRRMWGRLSTCGRLPIGLAGIGRNPPHDLAPCVRYPHA
jgi:hypothetical protein